MATLSRYSCSSSRRLRRAVLTACFAAVLGCALAARPALAKPVLAVTELLLDHLPERVGVVQWQGRPALLVLSEPFGDREKGELPTRRLSLFRLQGQSLREFAFWSVDEGLRWVEPLPGANPNGAWFGLNGSAWSIADAAVPRGAPLSWTPICECPSVFSLGMSSLRMDTPFVADLEGDGGLAVLLPDTNGLTVYALDAQGATLRPLWRDGWPPNERFEEVNGKLEARLSFPSYMIQDVNKDGVLDLLLQRGDTLESTIHPRRPFPEGREYFAFDATVRQRLRQSGLSAPAQLAVTELGDRGFDSRADAETALREIDAAALTELEAILAAARSPLPVFFPRHTGLRLKEEDDQQDRELVAIADMDGDRAPDVLELFSTDKGDPFNQKNQIRWYPGKSTASRYTLGEPAKTYFTEGLAFVELIRPNVRGDPALFLATMEVDVMALVKAIMLRRVTFEAYLYPWKDGALPQDATIKGDFTFSVELAEKGSRPMLLMADLDGDGRREFVFNLEQNKLFAFPSNPGNGRLGGTPIAQAELPLPKKAKEVLVADLEGSGREVLLVRYRGKAYSAKEQRTLRVVRWEDKLAK